MARVTYSYSPIHALAQSKGMNMKTAHAIKTMCDTAHAALALAENLAVSVDQDWQNEATIFTFEDESRLEFSGPFFEVRS